MKKIGKKLVFITLALALVFALSAGVSAAGAIDTEKPCSLTIQFEMDGVKIAGSQFDLYKVADVNAYHEVTPLDTYKDFPIDYESLSGSDWDAKALTMKGFVWQNNMKPDFTGSTDQNGVLPFEGLPCGIYLIIGHSTTIDNVIYEAIPYFVFLPMEDAELNDWCYDITSDPKKEKREVSLIERTVRKDWDDKGYEEERPKEVSVQLLCDGKVKETVVLNKDNNWRHTWKDLEPDKTWVVAEVPLEGYTVNTELKDTTFEITNKYDASVNPKKDPEITKKLPQTGMIWLPVPLLICAGLIFLIIGVWRRKNS